LSCRWHQPKATGWGELLVDGRAVLHPAAPCSAGYAAKRATDDDRVEVTH
jgi:hypothetical protein